jgi:hypothetical protein
VKHFELSVHCSRLGPGHRCGAEWGDKAAPDPAIYRNSRRVSAACHLQLVQFFFDDMKSIVADLLVGTHLENGLPGGLESSAMDFDVCVTRTIACGNIGSFACQMGRELLPDERDGG